MNTKATFMRRQQQSNDTSPSMRPSQVRQWRWRILRGGLVLLLALGGLTWLAGMWAKANLAKEYTPPGQMIDLGGYNLHLHCRGQGRPTVLLEAGLNDFSVQWALVQPAVAQFTQVCAYDRAGLGWSEPSPQPRTSAMMVDELHTLLTKAGVTGPYVLVGHSFGGINMRRFAHQYPDTVRGMVLVDAAHEAQGVRVPALHSATEQLIQQFRLLARLNGFGLLALAPTQIPNRGLPADALAQYRARLATSDYFKAAIAESAAFYTARNDASISNLTSLGELPLIVISRGQGAPLPGLTVAENEEYEQNWRSLQAELVALSSNSQQWMAEQSGHEIQLQQPALVIDAIRQLVQRE